MTKPSKKEVKPAPAVAAAPVPLPATLAELVSGATHFVFLPPPVEVRFLRMHPNWAHFAGDEAALPAHVVAQLVASSHVELLVAE